MFYTKLILILLLEISLAITQSAYAAPTPTPPEKVYRKDGREPREIFDKGFTPRGGNLNLVAHLQGVSVWRQNLSDREITGLISTTIDINAAVIFQPDIPGFVYEIIPHEETYDALLSLQHAIEQLPEEGDPRTFWEALHRFTLSNNQQQWVSSRSIPSARIVGAYPLIPNPQVPEHPTLGEFIPNPNHNRYVQSLASTEYFPANLALPSHFRYATERMTTELRSLAFSCLGIGGAGPSRTARSIDDDPYFSCIPETEVVFNESFVLDHSVSLRKVTEQNNFDFGSADRAWVDINGDNRLDHCATGGKNRTICMVYKNDNHYEKIEQTVKDIGWSDSRYWVDFNGDGITDYCRVIDNKTKLRCSLSTESGFFIKEITSKYIDAGYVKTRKFADINADNKADFCRLVYQHNEYSVQCLLGGDEIGRNTYMRDYSRSPKPRQDYGWHDSHAWGDIDGDGKDDLCLITGSGSHTLNCLFIANEDFSQDTPPITKTISPYPKSIALVDINGDQLADYCFQNKGIYCMLSNGRSLGDTVKTTISDIDFGKGTWNDINQDVKADYCQPTKHGIACYLSDGDGHFTLAQEKSSINDGYKKMVTAAPLFYSSVLCMDTNGYSSMGCYLIESSKRDSQCQILSYEQNEWVWVPYSGLTNKQTCTNANRCSDPGGTCFRWVVLNEVELSKQDGQCQVLSYEQNEWIWVPYTALTSERACTDANRCSDPGGTCFRWFKFK